MEAVTLKPGNYGGTYKLIGGEVSLDFINTVSWPGTDREHDWMDRPDNVTVWALAAGLIDKKTHSILDAQPQIQLWKDLDHVRQIRSNLRKVLWPLGFGEQISQMAIEVLNAQLHQTCALRCINSENCQWTWTDPANLIDIFAPVIWNAAHILTSMDHTRIRHCPSCTWLYYDTTRNRSRRWCDMKDCGSRDKALRYYHKAK